MGSPDSIDRLYGAAQGTLRVRLLDDAGEFQVSISGNRFVFEFLAEAISYLLECEDCKYDIAPFSAGCGWFGRTSEEDDDGLALVGPTVLNAGGLYFHRQPCVSDVVMFPSGRGVGWVCFPKAFDENETEYDHDPAYLMIEGHVAKLS